MVERPTSFQKRYLCVTLTALRELASEHKVREISGVVKVCLLLLQTHCHFAGYHVTKILILCICINNWVTFTVTVLASLKNITS